MKKAFFLILSACCITATNAQPDTNHFEEKNITVPVSGSTVEGSLLSSSPAQPLAVIIAGSGPTDRNGNNKLGITANSYKMLADELAKQNIATFRYDKRGIGASRIKNFNEAALSFDNYINDADAIYDYLKDSLGFKDIYFMGHSEGSLIGMIAAQKRPVKGYVSISGAGRPIDVVIEEQIKDQPPFVKNKVDSVFTILKQGQRVDSVPQYLYSLFRPGVQPYMIAWLQYNPADEIKKLKLPILILQGSCDIQVKVEDAQNLHKANQKSFIDIIPGMAHTLKDAGENCNDANHKTYTNSILPINKQLVKDIVSFIQKQKINP